MNSLMVVPYFSPSRLGQRWAHCMRVESTPMLSPWWPCPRVVGGANDHSITKPTKNEGSDYARHHGHGEMNPWPKRSNTVWSPDRLEGLIYRHKQHRTRTNTTTIQLHTTTGGVAHIHSTRDRPTWRHDVGIDIDRSCMDKYRWQVCNEMKSESCVDVEDGVNGVERFDLDDGRCWYETHMIPHQNNY
jgi:hypothetical protein